MGREYVEKSFADYDPENDNCDIEEKQFLEKQKSLKDDEELLEPFVYS